MIISFVSGTHILSFFITRRKRECASVPYCRKHRTIEVKRYKTSCGREIIPLLLVYALGIVNFSTLIINFTAFFICLIMKLKRELCASCDRKERERVSTYFRKFSFNASDFAENCRETHMRGGCAVGKLQIKRKKSFVSYGKQS